MHSFAVACCKSFLYMYTGDTQSFAGGERELLALLLFSDFVA